MSKLSIYYSILNILRKLGGKTMWQNLWDELQRTEVEVSKDELNQALLKLEIHGLVRVTNLDEVRRIVELVGED
jgi:Fe2+ or Zn2+ uptake regulation protein